MLESQFQAGLKEELRVRFPGCIILPGDANTIQGFPDLLILFGPTWAALECKRSAQAPLRPNQRYYVDLLDNLAFAAVVYPENMKEILDAMEQAFAVRGATRLPQSQSKRVVEVRRR